MLARPCPSPHPAGRSRRRMGRHIFQHGVAHERAGLLDKRGDLPRRQHSEARTKDHAPHSREPAHVIRLPAQAPRKRRGLPPGGGQRLVSRPVLNAPLELVHRRRCCPPGMPNDPYDLPNPSAPTPIDRGPAGGGQTLAVSTAALADPVCDSWHRRQIRLFPEKVDPSRTTSGLQMFAGAWRAGTFLSAKKGGDTCTSVSEHSSSSSCWSSSSSSFSAGEGAQSEYS